MNAQFRRSEQRVTDIGDYDRLIIQTFVDGFDHAADLQGLFGLGFKRPGRARLERFRNLANGRLRFSRDQASEEFFQR